MNEKALLNRAKLIEKAFKLSLSKVPRHSCHTQPFFGIRDFHSKRKQLNIVMTATKKNLQCNIDLQLKNSFGYKKIT